MIEPALKMQIYTDCKFLSDLFSYSCLGKLFENPDHSVWYTEREMYSPLNSNLQCFLKIQFNFTLVFFNKKKITLNASISGPRKKKSGFKLIELFSSLLHLFHLFWCCQQTNRSVSRNILFHPKIHFIFLGWAEFFFLKDQPLLTNYMD